MTTKFLGLLTVAVAITLSILSPRVARAEGAEDFVGNWVGTYYANGTEVRKSHLTLYTDELGFGIAGDWDGYTVIGASRNGNTLHLTLARAPRGGIPAPGVDHYGVSCELKPDGLSIRYVARSKEGVILASGGTLPGRGFTK